MVVFMRNEGFGPGTNTLIKCFGCGLVRKEKGDTMRVQGGNVFVVDECESMDDGQKVGLNLEMVLCDIDGNDGMGPVRSDESLKENPVFLP